MRAGAAHVEAAHGAAIAGPAGDGTQEEELLQRQLALENVALREAPLALEVERREHLTVADDLPDIGRIAGDRVDHRVAEGLALLVPRPFTQLVGRVLHETGKDVLSR